VSELVCLLEEPSARELLRGLLPRLVPDHVRPRLVAFEGKQDLHKNIVGKLRRWQQHDARFVVMRDQDRGDCRAIKAEVVELVRASGRSALVRIACRELEAWMLGDLSAIARAYGDSARLPEANSAKFRDPDSLDQPARVLRTIVPDYQKVDGARRIGPLLDPGSNRSTSFRAFCDGVRALYAFGAP
jgi:hypothetical protein